jgi:UDP-3-O-[3-hydroxymyristoyl] glucosamine N-acyltransferase
MAQDKQNPDQEKAFAIIKELLGNWKETDNRDRLLRKAVKSLGVKEAANFIQTAAGDNPDAEVFEDINIMQFLLTKWYPKEKAALEDLDAYLQRLVFRYVYSDDPKLAEMAVGSLPADDSEASINAAVHCLLSDNDDVRSSAAISCPGFSGPNGLKRLLEILPEYAGTERCWDILMAIDHMAYYYKDAPQAVMSAIEANLPAIQDSALGLAVEILWSGCGPSGLELAFRLAVKSPDPRIREYAKGELHYHCTVDEIINYAYKLEDSKDAQYRELAEELIQHFLFLKGVKKQKLQQHKQERLMANKNDHFSLSQLAEHLQGQLIEPAATELTITGAAGLDQAGPTDITFIDDAAKIAQAEASGAGAVIVPMEVEKLGKPAIRVANPRVAFAQVLALFAPPAEVAVGVHKTAIIGKEVKLGKGVAIGSYTIIGDNSRIEDGSVIYPHVYIGRNVHIGAQTTVWPNATIGWGSEIGARCIIYAGAVIGADGFGYTWDGMQHVKIPQIGRVVIEDEVEIGANTTIDRATTHITRIGRGTKIDNQVQIAHNCNIGEHCIIAGSVGISGSVTLGKGVILAGQVGVVDHITIGDGAIVLARSAVLYDLAAGGTYSGMPASPHREDLRQQAAGRKLPELLKEIRELRARLEKLEGK